MPVSPSDDTSVQAIGARIRQLRTERGLRQVELGGTDISTAYVSRIEAGQRRADRRILELLASRLGTTLDYLLTGLAPQDEAKIALTIRFAQLALRSGEAQTAENELRSLTTGERPLGAHEDTVALLLAAALESQGRLPEAVDLLEPLRALVSSPRWLPAIIALSRCYREAGDLTRSIDIAEDALARLPDEGLDELDEAVQLTVTLAAAYYERGDIFHATRLCEQAIRHAEKLASPNARASAYWNASVIASNAGSTAKAVTLAEKALALLGEGDDERNVSRLRLQLGTMLLRQDPPDVRSAEQVLKRARKELVTSGASTIDLARCDIDLARARLLAGDADRAEQLAEQALAGVDGRAPLAAADANALLGQVSMSRGDRGAARRRYQAAIAALTAVAADRRAAQLWYELAGFLDELGEEGDARDAYRRAGASVGLRQTAKLADVVVAPRLVSRAAD